MARVTFGGIAPIQTGTRVMLLVDDLSNPTKAISIEDVDHKISFRSAAPPSKASLFKSADYLAATVLSATVYVNENQTALDISITP
jgi:hypothetical protein